MPHLDVGVPPDAWLTAKAAYQKLLAAGVDGPDVELARDRNYRNLLMAGLTIFRFGGPDAVEAARSAIVAAVPASNPRHFDRLWDGLLNG